MKFKDIATKLNKQGVRTLVSEEFNVNIISRMLRNPLYSGRVHADDTIYTNIYPAIIEVEEFEKDNKMLAVGKRTAAQKKSPVPFILSGKLVCGKCKGQMTGESGTDRNGIHYYYKCHNKKNITLAIKRVLKRST